MSRVGKNPVPIPAGVTIDLKGGSDKLTLANGGNTATIGNVETITGGTGADEVHLSGTTNTLQINLGTGSDKLVLLDGGNTVTATAVESIIGGTGDDILEGGGGDETASIAEGNHRVRLPVAH